jgi:hypothetical protein
MVNGNDTGAVPQVRVLDLATWGAPWPAGSCRLGASARARQSADRQ